MPSIMGLNSITSVQMAAMPMVPAPMKRTFSFQSVIACSTRSPPAGTGDSAENHGTAAPQAMAIPSRMAMPPASPIR